MGDPLPHLDLGLDDMMRTDPRQDARVLTVERLGPDVADLQLREQRGGQDAGLLVVADGDHRALEVVDAERAERIDVGGVGGDHLPELTGQPLDHALPGVDRQHLGADPHQLGRQRRTESPQADDDDRFHEPSQR